MRKRGIDYDNMLCDYRFYEKGEYHHKRVAEEKAERSQTKKWISSLKVGDKLWVCYDGKMGRAKLAVVTRRIRGRVQIKFITSPYTNKIAKVWLDKKGEIWHSHSKSLMTWLFGLKGDYYRAYPFNEQYILYYKGLPNKYKQSYWCPKCDNWGEKLRRPINCPNCQSVLPVYT